jgi:CRISPR-associated protein Csm2
MNDVTFYKDYGKRTLKPDLFSKTAEELAKKIGEDGKRNKINKRTQLRKYYDEVLRLNSLSKVNPQDWDNILPYVNMLIAKVTYAEGRKLVTEDFVNFIKKSVEQIQIPKDLDVFANLFEAFMGFYKKHGPE